MDGGTAGAAGKLVVEPGELVGLLCEPVEPPVPAPPPPEPPDVPAELLAVDVVLPLLVLEPEPPKLEAPELGPVAVEPEPALPLVELEPKADEEPVPVDETPDAAPALDGAPKPLGLELAAALPDPEPFGAPAAELLAPEVVVMPPLPVTPPPFPAPPPPAPPDELAVPPPPPGPT